MHIFTIGRHTHANSITTHQFKLNSTSKIDILQSACFARCRHSPLLFWRPCISEWAKPEPKLKSTVHRTSSVDAAPSRRNSTTLPRHCRHGTEGKKIRKESKPAPERYSAPSRCLILISASPATTVSRSGKMNCRFSANASGSVLKRPLMVNALKSASSSARVSLVFE